MIVYSEFGDVHRSVDRAMRTKIISIFVGFCGVALLFMLGLRPPLRIKEHKKIVRHPCTEIVKSIGILTSPRMLMLIVTIVCVGKDRNTQKISSFHHSRVNFI